MLDGHENVDTLARALESMNPLSDFTCCEVVMGMTFFQGIAAMRNFLMMIVVLFTLAAITSTVAHAQPPGPQQPMEQDITAQAEEFIDGSYFKVTGPFGKSYFVTATEDMNFEKATRAMEGRVVVTKIYFEVTAENRGIQFINMMGTQVEFTPKAEEVDPKAPKPAVPPKKPETKVGLVTKANETVNFKEEGTVVVVLGRPIPQPEKPSKKKMPKKK
jgi:hypothetical protein